MVCLYIHLKCFEGTAQITILYELSYFTIIVFLYVSWLNDTYSNWTETEKTCSVICNNKGPDQPAHPRSLISNFVVCFFKRIIPRLASFKKMSIFYLACLAEGTCLRLAFVGSHRRQVFLRHGLCCLLDSSRTNISSATDNNIKNKYNEEAVHRIY